MNINDKIREVAKETEALVEENKKLEDNLRKQRHLKDEYKQMADEAVGQVQDLRELSKAQQQKLNDIYEASAKAHYEAELWQKRYESIEQCVQNRLEITPASIPYDNVRIMLKSIKRLDLHALD